jgi:hypothetical protein
MPFAGKTPQTASKQAKHVIYNSAVSMQNGKIVHFCHKQNEGYDADFDSNGEVFPLSERWLQLKKLDDLWKSWKSFSSSIDGKPENAVVSNTYKHEGIEFGVEICADHGSKVLATTGKKVDVQILISCGAKFMPSGMSLKEGGVAVQCEGSFDKDDTNKNAAFGVVKLVKSKFEPGIGAYNTSATGKTNNGKGIPDRIVVWDERIALP